MLYYAEDFEILQHAFPYIYIFQNFHVFTTSLARGYKIVKLVSILFWTATRIERSKPTENIFQRDVSKTRETWVFGKTLSIGF